MSQSFNYRHLYYFWVVAKEGGIARAAERLDMAVQTISAQVRELEKALGVSLLRSEGRNLVLTDAGVAAPTPWLLALSLDDYDTNGPVADVLGGRAMIATHFDGHPLAPQHGGPARLLVPHLYFWKSAKWIKGLKFTARDEAGFWELRGYHIYGDPWRQQRYSDDS